MQNPLKESKEGHYAVIEAKKSIVHTRGARVTTTRCDVIVKLCPEQPTSSARDRHYGDCLRCAPDTRHVGAHSTVLALD